METSRKGFSDSGQIVAPVTVAQKLHSHDLFYFTSQDLIQLFDLTAVRTSRLLKQLKSMGLIAEIENGKYLLLGFEPERVLSNPLFIASHIVQPAYVSYWSALHYYGFSEQAPRAVTVATTKKKRPIMILDQVFRYVTIKPRKFFGYQRLSVGELPVMLADEAKAIIDSLDQPRYAGGIAEVAKALAACLSTVAPQDLVAHANQMADRSLASRLGYLLETLAAGRPDGAEIMAALETLASATWPVKLDPGGRNVALIDECSRRWRVIPNLTFAQLFPGGVA